MAVAEDLTGGNECSYMSCDYAVWHTQERLSSTEALGLYHALCDGHTSGVLPDAAIDAFYAELTSLHPELNDVPEERIDDHDLCPWSNQIDRSPGHLILCCVWPKAEYVQGLVLSLARKHKLAIFDPQTAEIYYPDTFHPGLLTLTAEERPKKSPDLVDIQALVTRMDLGKGPSYVVLQGRGLDYAQSFGGRGVFTVEWREHNGVDFRHWRAGRREGPTSGETFVRGRTYEVQVEPGERLSAAEVLAILAAYLKGEDRPEQFQWQDISHRFA
jgi:hypothetical protein